MRKQRHEAQCLINCPMELALDLVGGKWKSIILFSLSEKTYRFNELQRALCKATPRTLTLQLRELEADGLIHREVYAQVPPKVEYSLTDVGTTLVPILSALKTWGETEGFKLIADNKLKAEA